jgi:hypothetical protein
MLLSNVVLLSMWAVSSQKKAAVSSYKTTTAKIPIMATIIINSIKVKPFFEKILDIKKFSFLIMFIIFP